MLGAVIQAVEIQAMQADWCETFFHSLMQDLFQLCINPVGWDDKQLRDCVLVNATTLTRKIMLMQPDDLSPQKRTVYEMVHGQYDRLNHRICLFFSKYRFGTEFSVNMPTFRVDIEFSVYGTATYTIQFDATHIRDWNNPLFRRFVDKAKPFYLNSNQLTLPAMQAAGTSFHETGDATHIQEIFELYMI